MIQEVELENVQECGISILGFRSDVIYDNVCSDRERKERNLSQNA